MNFFQVLRILWIWRLLIAVVCGTTVAAAGLFALSLPRVYTGESRVVLDVIKPDPVTGEVLNSSFARAYVQTQVEMIGDSAIAMRAAQSLGWENDPAWKERYLADQSPNDGGFQSWLANQIINGTSADLIEGTNIMSIKYSSGSPEVSRKVADALRKGYIEQSIVDRRSVAARNSQWFAAQAEATRAKLTAMETEKAEFERKNGVVLLADNSDPENDRLKALAGSAAPMAPISSGGVVASTAAASALAELDAQIAAKAARLGPNHPELVALRQQRPARVAAAANERAAAAAASRGAPQGPSIASQVNAAKSRVFEQARPLAYLRQLQARIEVMRLQFQKTSTRAADFNQQAQARESGVTELGPATAPSVPSSPKVDKIMAAAIAGGLALSLMLALFMELLRRKVRSVHDLSSLPVPIIGVITHEKRAVGGQLAWAKA